MWLDLVPQVDDLRGRTKLKGKPTPEQIEELRTVKEQLGRLEEELASAAARRDELLSIVPNPPDPTAPDGFTEEDAAEVRRVGEPPQFAFEPRDHLELGWIDMERVRASPVRVSRTGWATSRWPSWRSTGSRSTQLLRKALFLSSRRCSSARRRCTA